tara:strand:+ start:438 stop:728 length:291 start_codon:yes stop_codon:yes gene_type:complete
VVNKKTIDQKKQDQKDFDNGLKQLLENVKDMQDTFYDCEFDLTWLRVGTVSNIFTARDKIKNAQNRIKELYTYTDYESDKKHKYFKKATHIRYYNN